MAEGYFRELTRKRGGYEVMSAGIGAMNGQAPSANAVAVLAEQRIDITAQRVIERLRSARPDAATLSNQDQIAMMFEIMANALKAAQREDPFASGGAGNGAGGGGAASSLVPPLAELRLLRGLQQDVYRRTRNLDKQELHTDNESELRKQLQRLATEQRQLAGLGQQLIEQTRNTLEFTESPPASREKP